MTAQERRDRAAKIRAARERIPTPSYQTIAHEVGCSEKTVFNVLTQRTHKERFKEAHERVLETWAPTLAKLAAYDRGE